MTTETYSYVPPIPFDVLDDFVFNEAMPVLHPTLRPYLNDMKYILHYEENTVVDSVEAWSPNPYYICVPWYFADVFPLPEEQLNTMGRVHLLSALDNALSDHVVDGQVEEPAETLLAISQIRALAMTQLQTLFEQGHPYWEVYNQAQHNVWRAFAEEVQLVDKQAAPLTLDGFKALCDGKYDIHLRTTYAMSYLSGDLDKMPALKTATQNFFRAECMLDDIQDWRADLEGGRRTYVIQQVMDAADIPAEDFGTLTIPQLSSLFVDKKVLSGCAKTALAFLETSREALGSVDLQDSHIGQLVEQRYKNARVILNIIHALNGVNRFRFALGG